MPGELLGEPAHLDHDHDTPGAVRGLLCIPCNTIREPIGLPARDDVAPEVSCPPSPQRPGEDPDRDAGRDPRRLLGHLRSLPVEAEHDRYEALP